jgi:cellulose biosynthesis protein BcsQ
MSIVEPLLLDEPKISFRKSVVEKRKNRFSVHVLMGHPKLSLIEDRLGEAWGKIAGGDVGAFRKTNWCNSLISKLRPDYDYIFVDLGPSLGALNRSALIATDYFVTPMSIDIFSLIGLRNISEWINEWSDRYAIGVSNFKSGSYAQKAAQFDIKLSLSIKEGFIGYTTQAYIPTKTQLGGKKRPTKAFEKILSKFESEFDKDLGAFFKPGLPTEKLVLGQIPNMFGLAPLAQSSNAPVRSLKASDGVFGQHYYQVEKFMAIFDEIADNLIFNAGVCDD